MSNTDVLRIIDANLNRSREALRVVEEYARFVLDSSVLAGELKTMRHDLRAAADMLPAVDLLASRDTAGDVGTRISTAAEMARADLAEVVRAAMKRLAESLRALEEYSKLVCPAAAAAFESLRYRCYRMEKTLGGLLQGSSKLANMRLYVLVTQSLCRVDVLETVEAVCAGGADVIQMREKEMAAGRQVELGRQMAEICRRHNVLLVVNDRADVARAIGADGVHVGQDDLSVRACRQVLGPRSLVGVSCQTPQMALAAVEAGADYIGVGPVYASPTKPRGYTIEPAGVAAVRGAVKLPTVAIAGITIENVEALLETCGTAVAVCSDIIAADDPQARTAAMKAAILRHHPV